MSAQLTPPRVRWEESRSRWMGLLGYLVDLLGPMYLVVVVGGGVWMQGARLPEPPMAWLRAAAWLGLLIVAIVLASGRLSRPVWAVGAGLTVWMGAGAISAQGLTGHLETRSMLLGIVCAGLFFSVAAARPSWTGWFIIILGGAYIGLNLIAYYRGYYSLGHAYTGATWWYDPMVGYGPVLGRPENYVGTGTLPYPDGMLQRVVVLIKDAPQLNGFYFGGLSVNPNHTGNYVAPILPFVIPFLAHRWRHRAAAHPRLTWMVRGLLSAAILVPGFFLLYLLDARAALGAAVASVAVTAVPMSWTRQRFWAPLAAVLVPMAMAVPYLLTLVRGISWNGRDCVWESWGPLIRQSPLWGIGPPGKFMGYCAHLEASIEFPHVHNEVLQAWSIGGLLGLLACIGTLAGLSWYALRYRSLDDGALMAMMVLAAVLMGVEVLATFLDSNWVFLGIGWFIAVSARSMGTVARTQAHGDEQRLGV